MCLLECIEAIGEIGIGKGDDGTAACEHARANRRPFSAVGNESDHSAAARVSRGDLGGRVATAVIDHQDLDAEFAAGCPFCEAVERSRQPREFVVRRHDDRKAKPVDQGRRSIEAWKQDRMRERRGHAVKETLGLRRFGSEGCIEVIGFKTGRTCPAHGKLILPGVAVIHYLTQSAYALRVDGRFLAQGAS
jgi:hypothetical protein